MPQNKRFREYSQKINSLSPENLAPEMRAMKR